MQRCLRAEINAKLIPWKRRNLLVYSAFILANVTATHYWIAVKINDIDANNNECIINTYTMNCILLTLLLHMWIHAKSTHVLIIFFWLLRTILSFFTSIKLSYGRFKIIRARMVTLTYTSKTEWYMYAARLHTHTWAFTTQKYPGCISRSSYKLHLISEIR